MITYAMCAITIALFTVAINTGSWSWVVAAMASATVLLFGLAVRWMVWDDDYK